MSKTISVEKLRLKINEMAAKSTCSSDTRQGALNVLEWVLHETDNYNGFMFLESSEVPLKEKPGIIRLSQNSHTRLGTDSTRVRYF